MKPHNILLAAEDGRTLVTDFGIARLMRDDDQHGLAAVARGALDVIDLGDRIELLERDAGAVARERLHVGTYSPRQRRPLRSSMRILEPGNR